LGAGCGPLDLARLLVVVPMRPSGRRLREALAELEHAATHDQAVFLPRVLTPAALTSHGLPAGAARRLESLLAWAAVPREADLAEFREVFPLEPPGAPRDVGAAGGRARGGRLQAALGEGGRRIGDVVAGAGGDFPETVRWRQTGKLERRYDGQLGAIGRSDGRAGRIAGAENPAALERIVVLAPPDPLPLAWRALAALARVVPVQVAA